MITPVFFERTQGQRGRFFKFAAQHIRDSELPGVHVSIALAVRETIIEDQYHLKHTKAQISVEIERRQQICEDILCVLSGDEHWGLERAKDHLHEYLRILLDGGDLSPSDRKMWAAGDGRVLINDDDVRTRINPSELRA